MGWILPLAAVILFITVLLSLDFGPIQWVQLRLQSGRTVFADLATQIEPRIMVESTPITVNQNRPQLAAPTAQVSVQTSNESQAGLTDSSDDGGDRQNVAMAATTAAATATTEPTFTGTATSTNTTIPTATPSSTATATPTVTRRATSTPLPPTSTAAPSQDEQANSIVQADSQTTDAANPRTVSDILEGQSASGSTVGDSDGMVVGQDDSALQVASAITVTTLVNNNGAFDVAKLSTAMAQSSTPTNTPAPEPTTTSTFTPAPSATSTATLTATSTATSTSTPSPSATATATAELQTYQILGGDTLLAIASRHGTTARAIMELNGLSSEDTRRLRPGQTLFIPASASTTQNAPTATPEEPKPPQEYVVSSGDTILAIARRFDVSSNAILAANGLAREEATRIQVGQVLVIPSNGDTGNPNDILATAGETTVNYRLDAPKLRSPDDGTPMSCGRRDSLTWDSVPFMGPADRYVLHMGFVSGYEQNGEPIITWVIEQTRERERTSWDLEDVYCSLAPQEFGRTWYWYVQVVNENSVAVSPPSESHQFTWR